MSFQSDLIFSQKRAPGTRTQLDSLLAKFHETRREIITSLEGNPESLIGIWGNILTVDITCQAHMTPYNSLKACHHCQELGHLFDLDIDVPFVLECGEYVGRELIVRFPTTEPISLEFDKELIEQGNRILATSPLLGKCGFIPIEHYLICDTLTNEILIRSLFNEVLLSPNVFITAFQCGPSRYLLESYSTSWYSNHFKISQLSPTQCYDITIQLIANLFQLNDHQIILGELDSRSILVDNNPISWIIQEHGIHIKGPFGVSFAYTHGSSMSIGNVRICSTMSPKVVANVHPNIKIWTVASEGDKLITVYSLDAGTRTNFIRHRRSGIPLYPGSLELYIILIVICCHRNFYEMLILHFKDLWRRLWIGKFDMEMITSKLLEWQEKAYQPTHDEIIDVLQGCYLRCDALEISWNTIRGQQDMRRASE